MNPKAKCLKVESDGAVYYELEVSPKAKRKVKAIEKEAMAKGWSKDSLYRNRADLLFPYGGQYGLVCFVDDDRANGLVIEIESVSEQEIVLAQKNRLGIEVRRRFSRRG